MAIDNVIEGDWTGASTSSLTAPSYMDVGRQQTAMHYFTGELRNVHVYESVPSPPLPPALPPQPRVPVLTIRTAGELFGALSTGGGLDLILAEGVAIELDGTELNITDGMEVAMRGEGAGATLVAGDSARVGRVRSGGRLAMHNLVLTHGRAQGDGGCLLVDDNAELFLADSLLEECEAQASSASASDALGGAIAVSGSGTVELVRSSILNSRAVAFGTGDARGGGIRAQGRSVVTCTDVVMANVRAISHGNQGLAAGGAIEATDTAQVQIERMSLRETHALSKEFIAHRAAEGRSPRALGGALNFDDSTRLTATDLTIVNSSATIEAAAPGSCSIGGCVQHVAVGGAMCLVQQAQATLTNFKIANSRAVNYGVGMVAGGGMSVEMDAQASVTNLTITNSRVISFGEACQRPHECLAAGGAILMMSAPEITTLVRPILALDGAVISDAQVTSSGNLVSGGAISLDREAELDVVNAQIHETSAINLRGGTGRAFGGGISVAQKAQLRMSHTSITSSRVIGAAAFGGGLSVSSTSTQFITSLSNVTIRDCEATGNGGGMYVLGGSTRLANASHLVDNVANESGANFFAQGGESIYLLPAPSGTWIAATDCQVLRQPCELEVGTANPKHQECERTALACSQTPNRTAIVTNETTGVGWQCMEPLLIQPCDWERSPELLNANLQALPPLAVDENFPFDCVPGILGSTDPAKQKGPRCAGVCPEGTFQPERRGLECQPCPSSFFCPLGSLQPRRCPDGTVGNREQIASNDCADCPDGSWCNGGRDFACDVGLYSFGPARNRTNLNGCRRCPELSTTFSAGTAGLAGCGAHMRRSVDRPILSLASSRLPPLPMNCPLTHLSSPAQSARLALSRRPCAAAAEA